MKADLETLSKQQADNSNIHLEEYAIPLTNGDGKISIYVKDVRLSESELNANWKALTIIF